MYSAVHCVTYHLPQDPHDKIDKGRRGAVYAQWLVDKFSMAALCTGEGVCDVAGGRGDLSFELFNVRGIKTTIIDPREPKLRPVQRRRVRAPRLKGQHSEEKEYGIERLEAATEPALNISTAVNAPSTDATASTLNSLPAPSIAVTPTAPSAANGASRRNPYDREAHVLCPHIRAEFGTELLNQRRAFFEKVSLFVGLHPDQATEPIVDLALSLGKPFAVVPCCVFPTENPHRKLSDGTPVVTYAQFITYLRAKHPEIEVEFLPLQGANQVLFYRGKRFP